MKEFLKKILRGALVSVELSGCVLSFIYFIESIVTNNVPKILLSGFGIVLFVCGLLFVFDGEDRAEEEKDLFSYKINLVTQKDIGEFVAKMQTIKGKVYITDKSLKINAKSLLGVLSAVEWKHLYCESEEDIYEIIKEWTKN